MKKIFVIVLYLSLVMSFQVNAKDKFNNILGQARFVQTKMFKIELPVYFGVIQNYYMNTQTEPIFRVDKNGREKFECFLITFSSSVANLPEEKRWFVIAHELAHVIQYQKVIKTEDSQLKESIVKVFEEKGFEQEADQITTKVLCKHFGEREGWRLAEEGFKAVCFPSPYEQGCKFDTHYYPFEFRRLAMIRACKE